METNDEMARASDTPDVRELAKEYNRSLNEGYSLERVAELDDVRFTRWASQSDDGKKHDVNMKEGTQAFPWDGASDTRIPLADSIINDTVDILSTAFSRATLKVGGTGAEECLEASRHHDGRDHADGRSDGGGKPVEGFAGTHYGRGAGGCCGWNFTSAVPRSGGEGS